MGKIIGLLCVILLFLVLFNPRLLPRLLRRLGLALRDVGKVGSELASGEEVPDSALAKYEVQAGGLLLLKIEASTLSCTDDSITSRVQEIGDQVAKGARRTSIPYRFHVLEDPEPNAFAVPGGSIFITRALVEMAGDDHEIAGVLGHEVAHIELRHALYQKAAQALARTGFRILTLGRAAILSRLSGQMEELLVKGYSRDQELAADHTGASLSRAAGYEPLALATLLERLSNSGDDGHSGDDRRSATELLRYFQTHPPARERIARIRQRFGAASQDVKRR